VKIFGSEFLALSLEGCNALAVVGGAALRAIEHGLEVRQDRLGGGCGLPPHGVEMGQQQG